jgi:hypothetical protein
MGRPARLLCRLPLRTSWERLRRERADSRSVRAMQKLTASRSARSVVVPSERLATLVLRRPLVARDAEVIEDRRLDIPDRLSRARGAAVDAIDIARSGERRRSAGRPVTRLVGLIARRREFLKPPARGLGQASCVRADVRVDDVQVAPTLPRNVKLMRRAPFCTQRAAEEEWRGVGEEFNDVVHRRRRSRRAGRGAGAR